MIWRTLSCRLYHTSNTFYAAGTSTSLLAKLRKSTGFSISNCKKALENFPDDLKKAEEWLHSEAKKMGWSKWNKIQSRKAAQGLIGVYAEDNLGVMVEVNCETDFVAKNVEFHNLVENILLSCVEKTKECAVTGDKRFEKHLLSEEDLMGLKFNSLTMQELVNAAISKFNEKTVLKRAVLLKSKEDVSITGLTHPAEKSHQMLLGKFGALVTVQAKDKEAATLGADMCQHIIGMNPSSIGAEDLIRMQEEELNASNEQQSLNETPAEKESPTLNASKAETSASEEVVSDSSASQEEVEEENQTSGLKESDESRLLFQSYLLDPNVRVHDYIKEQGQVLDFERFECGGGC